MGLLSQRPPEIQEAALLSWRPIKRHPLGAALIVFLLLAVLGAGWVLSAAEAGPNLVNGKNVYVGMCTRCHGVSGKGDGPKAETLDKEPTDFTNKKRMGEVTDAQLKQIVLEGKPSMPSYKGKMSDEDLDDVIAYIRTFSGK
jgi:mono/diheme cytochrome c family protein